MTSLADARSTLATALETAGVTVSPTVGRLAPPMAIIFGAGIDPAHLVRGQVEAGLRVMLVSAKADQESAIADLGDMVLLTIAAVRALAGYRLGTIGVDTIRRLPSGEYLTADVTCHRFVDPTLPEPEEEP